MKKLHSIMVVTACFAATTLFQSCGKWKDGSADASKDPSPTVHYSLLDTVDLSADADSRMFIALDIEVPADETQPSAAMVQIQDALKSLLFADRFNQLPFDSAMAAYADYVGKNYKSEFVEQAQRLVSDIRQTDDSLLYVAEPNEFENELYVSAGVQYDSAGVMSYSIERIINFGQATGMSRCTYVNFDKTDGSIIDEERLFIDGYEADLTHRLLSAIVDQTDEVELIKDLVDNDYEVQSIRPNNNFYFSQEGIVYMFNLTDLGPYIPEGTQVVISWQNVKPLLKDEWKHLAD
ncbi:MAG: DUF3298 domain-containing protein [Paludibacteraceae bacterium]|nr:DUF3298 domain-containing protein [Paludibacteraceae bacterium]